MRRLYLYIIAYFILGLSLAFYVKAEPVHTAIIIANDYSGSMNKHRTDFQFNALIQALRSTEFKTTLRYKRPRAIALKYVMWADYPVGSKWFILKRDEDIENVISEIRNFTEQNKELFEKKLFATETSNVMKYAHNEFRVLEGKGISANRFVLDISSDGEGYRTDEALEWKSKFLHYGYIINAIIMFNPTHGQTYEWYRKNVVVGPGSFVIQVDTGNLHQYTEKFILKFINEIM